MSERMLRLPAVLERRGCSKSKLYCDIREGRFPRPVKVGPRLSAWLESDLEAEQKALIEERGTAGAQAA